ncbi:MAG: restriction endonuclease subunit S [Deltaproteobacteria bacterium]|nr:restriction endonuclease subunit S [Deltaproteobacteria bacterium]
MKIENARLPKGWEIKKLGDVLKLEYGKPLDKSKRKSTGLYPVYGANGIKARSDESYYDKQSIIVGRKGSAGEINLTENNFWPLDVTYFVTFDDKKYDLFFLFYLLSKLALPRLAKGVKPGINRNDVYSLTASIPPLPEQKRIVAILDKAFTAIDKAKANAKKNLANAKELFESCLNGIFENPGEDWEEKKLGEICEFRNGRAHEKIIDDKGQYIVINSKYISTNGAIYKRSNEQLTPLYKNEIVFVMSDVPKGKALAKCFIIDKNDMYTLNQRIGALTLKKVNTCFFFYQFNRNKYLLSFDNGENQTNLRKNDILKCPLYIPALIEQTRIVAKLDSLSTKTKRLEKIYQQKIADVEELKKSILKKAFEGEL